MVTRKYVRTVILLACGIALVLASSGCKKKAEDKKGEEPTIKAPTKKEPTVKTPTKKEPTVVTPVEKAIVQRTGKTFVIEPLVGIGKVRFGMTVEQMNKILGPPQEAKGPLHEYRDAGFAIFAMNDAVTMIACGDRRRADSPLVKGCRCRTKKGIGMGSSKEDVVKAYGEPSSTKQMPGGAVTLRYNQLYSEFLLRDDKVTYMMFRGERSSLGM